MLFKSLYKYILYNFLSYNPWLVKKYSNLKKLTRYKCDTCSDDHKKIF